MRWSHGERKREIEKLDICKWPITATELKPVFMFCVRCVRCTHPNTSWKCLLLIPLACSTFYILLLWVCVCVCLRVMRRSTNIHVHLSKCECFSCCEVAVFVQFNYLRRPFFNFPKRRKTAEKNRSYFICFGWIDLCMYYVRHTYL